MSDSDGRSIPKLGENPGAKFKESPIEDTSEKLKILSIRFTTALTALLTVNKNIFLTTDEFAAVILGDGPQLCGCRDVVVQTSSIGMALSSESVTNLRYVGVL